MHHPFQQVTFLVAIFLASLFTIRYVLPTFAQPQPTKTPKFGIFFPPTITSTPTPTNTPTPTLTPTPTITPIPSPVWTGPSPTPTPSNSELVIGLVNSIKANCKPDGYVGYGNYNCLYNITPPLAPLVLQELKRSAEWNGWLQCVGFVRAAVSLTLGITLGNSGNAIEYASEIPAGYRFIRNDNRDIIQVEDIPIWDYDNSVGHMAYVIYVNDWKNFQVAEANYGYTSGKVRISNTTINSSGLIGWLRRI